MPRTYQFRTLDVFTSTAYAGNQLGIVTVPAANPLTQAEKQAIAVEFNLSETIFVHEPEPASAESSTPVVTVDIFTIESELPFAGHPTVGAIHHILSHVLPSESSVSVRLKSGLVAGSKTGNVVRAQMPHRGYHQHGAALTWDAVEKAQPGLASSKMNDGRAFPLASPAPGVNFALVDLTDAPELLTKVVATKTNVADSKDLDKDLSDGLIGTIFFARRPAESDGVVRIDQRVIVMGFEDPATGAASCALTAYLALENGQAGEHRFELVQGEQMGRKSVIGVEVGLTNGSDKGVDRIEKIVLSGQCKAVMKGELEI